MKVVYVFSVIRTTTWINNCCMLIIKMVSSHCQCIFLVSKVASVMWSACIIGLFSIFPHTEFNWKDPVFLLLFSIDFFLNSLSACSFRCHERKLHAQCSKRLSCLGDFFLYFI